MAKKSNVHRPTENTAIGLAELRPRPMAALERLYALLAHAVRCHDRRGAQLLRNMLVRAMAGGTVGEA